MKQFLFLVAVMAYFSVRSLVDPFWAVLMYYGLAVLRPQAIWEWALNPAAGGPVRWSVFAAIVVFVALIFHLASLRPRAASWPFIALIALFGLCLVGSHHVALDPAIAGRSGWEMAKILIMLFLSCFIVTQRRHVRYLAFMILVCLVYLVYEVNALYIFDRRLDIYHHGYGGLDNNGAALMLAMAAPFCYFFFQAERRWWRWGYLVCILPVIHAVMLTYSRGAMVSLLVVGVGIMIQMVRRSPIKTLAMGAVLTAAVLFLAGPEVRARFLTSVGDADPGQSKASRLTSWRAGLAIAMDYPLFGVGLRNSNLLTKDYGCDLEGRTIHNIYLQIAADAGIPAGIIFTTLIGMSLWCLYRSARATRDRLADSEMRWHHCICLAAFWSLTMFALGSIFLSFETLELSYLLMLFGAVAPKLSRTDPTEQAAPELDVRPWLPIKGQPA